MLLVGGGGFLAGRRRLAGDASVPAPPVGKVALEDTDVEAIRQEVDEQVKALNEAKETGNRHEFRSRIAARNERIRRIIDSVHPDD